LYGVCLIVSVIGLSIGIRGIVGSIDYPMASQALTYTNIALISLFGYEIYAT
jgi:hypothetical protein